MNLEISVACQNTDRTVALRDGRVRIDGCSATFLSPSIEDIFRRAFRHVEFDVAELSLSTHLLTTARGDSQYIAVPAFVSRSFRHSAIYVRSDRGISGAAYLKGRRIGVPDFQQTAGVWVRGMLADEYNVLPTDIEWKTGGLELPGQVPRVSLDLPEKMSVRPIEPTQTLSSMLAAGELDAIIAPTPPSCMADTGVVARLFTDYRTAEEAYYAKTKLFPLMHVIGIRRELASQHPWLPVNVYKAFVEAKAIAVRDLGGMGIAQATHPWIAAETTRVQKLMGHDFWRYGITENTNELQTFLRYARADGLITRDVNLRELFTSSTFDLRGS
jgi:4,5-dihydroxyphthalate decarboxylase